MEEFNSSINQSIFQNIFFEKISEINSNNYKSNNFYEPLPTFFEKNCDELKFDNIANIYQNNLVENENQIEMNKNIFNELSFKEIENKKGKFSLSIDNFQENKTNNNNIGNIEDNNTNNINNLTSNNNIIYEEKKENYKNNIFDVMHSNNFNNFNIFNKRNDDNFPSNMIYEALNDVNKNCKILQNKKIFRKRPKKRKNILKRKNNADNIRKKIKSRFLKALINAINQKLKSAGSKYFFNLFPQSFIINISKEKNKEILDLSLKEIFLKNFNDKEKGKRANFNNILKRLELN